MRKNDTDQACSASTSLPKPSPGAPGRAADQSYTRSLLDKGAAHCARKFGEEAIELTIAAAAEDENAVRAEAADVLYHLLVVLQRAGFPFASVMSELEGRTRQSGHKEKASRKS